MLLCCSPKLYLNAEKTDVHVDDLANDRCGLRTWRRVVSETRAVMLRARGEGSTTAGMVFALADVAAGEILSMPLRRPWTSAPSRCSAISAVRTAIRASASGTGNYQNVFARDAVMAGIAGMMLGDSTIIDGFVRTLERLRDLQGAEGQIASNYAVRDGQPVHVSFGTLVPRIDANTWYLIGIALGARAGVIDPAAYRDSVRAVVRLLDALEYNGRHLIYIPVGGNWADEYVYEGYVLYDQLLRVWALRLLGAAYGEARWEEKSALIAQVIDRAYWPEERRLPHPVSAFSPTECRGTFDLAACSLLGMSGVTDSRVDTTLDWIAERFTRQARLPPAFDGADETHPEWPALRGISCRLPHHPHEYHNGGIWPIWLAGWRLRWCVTDALMT